MKKRIRNIFVTVLALFCSLFKSKEKIGSQFQSFVVIYSTGNIGDMVCVTPLFHAIKKQYPHAKVTVIGSLKNKELLDQNEDIDEYIDISKSIWSLILILRKMKIDAGISINPNPIDIGILYLGLIKKISSYAFISEYSYMQNRAYKMISSLIELVPYTPGEYVPRQHLNLLKPFGIVAHDIQKRLKCSDKASTEVAEKLHALGITKNHKIIAIAPGAGAEIKRWPADRFAAVASALYHQFDTPIVIIGGPGDQHAIKEMINALEHDVLYYSPGPANMDFLKATLARASLVIGNDSGAIHVGEAVGSATLTIAGSTDDGEHMISDDRHLVVRGVSDSKTLFRSYISDDTKMDVERARRQMETVTVDMVSNVAQKFFH